MNRRTVLAGVGASLAGAGAGCLGTPLTSSRKAAPRLVGIQVGNWYLESQRVHVEIQADETLFETDVELEGGDPSEYDKPSRNLDGPPSDLPPAATFTTWVQPGSAEEGHTLVLGDQPYEECLGVRVAVCPTCERQTGEATVTAPDAPDILVLTTSSCTYPG